MPEYNQTKFDELNARYEELKLVYNKVCEDNMSLNERLEKSECEREYMKEENICLQQEKIILKAKLDMVYLIFSGYRG